MAGALVGKTAVVTGSTSGIGLAYVRAFAAEGVDVMLNGFGDAEEIEAIRSGLAAEHGVRAVYHPADMTKPAEIADMIDSANGELGGIDILVNNAGIQHTAPVEDFGEERWDTIIAINLSSAFHTIRAVLPQMKARNWGRIINTASAHGLVASIHKAGYVSAKHGMIGLTKVVGLETAETGVTCNAICPGWVRTPLVERQIEALAAKNRLSIEDAARELLGVKQPSKAFVSPEQVAQFAVFLCSDAGAQITGAALSIDGGWVAQ